MKQQITITTGKLMDRRGRIFLRAARILASDKSMTQAGAALHKAGAGFLDFRLFAMLNQPGDFADKNHRIFALLFADEYYQSLKP